MRYLIQLLLPLSDNEGRAIAPHKIKQVEDELKNQFGGVTTYTRSPAKGLWINDDNLCVDDIVVVEVMVESIDHEWWKDYRTQLEQRFEQEEILARALGIQQL